VEGIKEKGKPPKRQMDSITAWTGLNFVEPLRLVSSSSSSSFYLNQATWPMSINKRHTLMVFTLREADDCQLSDISMR